MNYKKFCLLPRVLWVALQFFPNASHLLKQSFYRRKQHGSAVIMASRGCPLRCSYCAVSADCGLPFRKRDVATTLSEIEQAVTTDDVGFID